MDISCSRAKRFDLLSLGAYSFAHFIVDFSCAFLLFRLVRVNAFSADSIVVVFGLYNTLAFGLEFLIGLFFNARTARIASVCGETLLAGGLLAGAFVVHVIVDNNEMFDLLSSFCLPFWGRANGLVLCSILACVFAGIGNAFFHVGGGIDSLTRNYGKHWRPGTFISTGALGLSLGIYYGNNSELGLTFVHVLSMTIISAGGVWFFCKSPYDDSIIIHEKDSCLSLTRNCFSSRSFGILLALLFVIFSRSLVGFLATEIWNVRHVPAFPGIALAFAAFAGKFLGGFGADLLNARLCGVLAIITPIPLLFLSSSLSMFWLGVLLLNSTTAITLTATARNCGKSVGFAFGLTTLALLAGFFVYDWIALLIERCDCLSSVTTVLIVVMIVSALAMAVSIKQER